MEAPTRFLTNARFDIYPGRLWAVAAALAEVIQPAVQNEIYSEGCGQLGPIDIWGLYVDIQYPDLPTQRLTRELLEPFRAYAGCYQGLYMMERNKETGAILSVGSQSKCLPSHFY